MSQEVGKGPVPIPRVSYAQNGEDILLDRVFGDHVGTFVDVGACHPTYHNNTYFFYLRGWRGVNIEPIPWLRAEFDRVRPDDLNLSVAAGDVEGELPFYEIPSSGGLSTLSAELAGEYRGQGLEVVERRVRVRTVASLVEENAIAPPDLLTVDAEGTEAQVIRGIPLDRWRPRVIVVESTWPQTTIPSHEDWEPILLAQRYLFAAFNGVNRFYLRDDLREKLGCLEIPVSVLDHFVPFEIHELESKIQGLHARLLEETALFDAQRKEFQAQHEGFVRGYAEFERGYAEFRRAYSEFEATHRQHALDREDWERRQGEWDREQSEWDRERLARDQERLAWDRERLARDQERLALEGQQSDLEGRLDACERALAAIREECSAYQAQLVALQRLLRPYRLIDRLGVVTAGYEMARRIKHKRAAV